MPKITLGLNIATKTLHTAALNYARTKLSFQQATTERAYKYGIAATNTKMSELSEAALLYLGAVDADQEKNRG